MTNLTSLKFDNAQFGKQMQLIGVEPFYKYENGKKTDFVGGYKYEVVLLQMNYEKIEVKIEGDRQIEQMEKYDVPVKFNGLEVGFYQDFTTKNLHLKATAKAIEIVK